MLHSHFVVCEVTFALLGFAVSFILCQSYHRVSLPKMQNRFQRDSVLVGASWMTWMILHILLSFFALRPLIDEVSTPPLLPKLMIFHSLCLRILPN